MQPQQQWPTQPWVGGPAGVPLAPRRRGRGAGIAAVVVAATLAAGGTGYVIGRHHSAPTPPTASSPADDGVAVLSPDAAAAQVCRVLKEGYPAVVAAMDADNALKTAPWSDPNLLAAVNHFVVTAAQLADRLDGALSPSTPPDLRAAVVNYTAGLRALSVSEADHAPDAQINGVGAYYNAVRHPPLRLCGLPE